MMSSSCFVKNCTSGLETFKVVNNDPGITSQWVEALPPRERPFNPELDIVCAAHFAPGCLHKKQVYILSGGELKVDESRSKIVLQPGAVPTIFDCCVEDDVKEEFEEASREINDGNVNNEVSCSKGDQPMREKGLHLDGNEVRQPSQPPPQSERPSQAHVEDDDTTETEVKLEDESHDELQNKVPDEQSNPSQDVLPSPHLPSHSTPVPEQETQKTNSASGTVELTVETSSNPQPPRRGKAPPKLFPQRPLIRVKPFAELREPELEDEDPENDKDGIDKPGELDDGRTPSPLPPVLVRAVTGSSGQPSPALSVDAPPVLVPEGVRKEHSNISLAISNRIKRVGIKTLVDKIVKVAGKGQTKQVDSEVISKEVANQVHEKPQGNEAPRGRGRPKKHLLIVRKKLPKKVPAVTLVLQTTPAVANPTYTSTTTRRSMGELTKVSASGRSVPVLSGTRRKSALSLRNHADVVPISANSSSLASTANGNQSSNISTNEATAKIGRARILARKKPTTLHQVPSKKPSIQPMILLEPVKMPTKSPRNSAPPAQTRTNRAKITSQMKGLALKKSAKQFASVPVASKQVPAILNEKPPLKRLGRPPKRFRGFARKNIADVPKSSEQPFMSVNKSQNGSQKVKNSVVGRPSARNVDSSKKKNLKASLQPVILIERLSPQQIADLQQQVRDEARSHPKSNSQAQHDSGPKLLVGRKRKSAGRPPGPLSKRKVVATEPPASTGAIRPPSSHTPETSGRKISTRNHQLSRKNHNDVSSPVLNVVLRQNMQEITSKKNSDCPKKKTKNSVEPENLKLIQSGFSTVPMYTLTERTPGRRKPEKSSERVETPAAPIANPLDAEETTKQSSQLSGEKANASVITSDKKRGRPSKNGAEMMTAHKKTVDDEKQTDHPHGTRSKSFSADDPGIWEPSTEPFVIENDYDSDVVPASPVSDPLDVGGVEKTDLPSGQEEETMETNHESSPESKRPAFGGKKTCFVLTCLQKSKKFFHAPSGNPDLFRKWAARIPQRERSLTERDLICADHFEKGKIRKTVKAPWGKVLPLAEHRWKLQPGAVPTVFRTPRILLRRLQTNNRGYSPAASNASREVEDENIEKCVVPGCTKFRGMKMHEFPFYMTYRKLWVREISRKTGVSIPDKDEFLFGKKACGHHFVASDYQGGVRSNPLKLSAVPSRFELVGNSDRRPSVSSASSSIRVVRDKKDDLARASVSSTGKNDPISENEDEIVTVYDSTKPSGTARRKQNIRPGAPSSKIASVSPSRRVARESPGMNAAAHTSAESAKQVQQPISSSHVTMNPHSIVFQQSKPVGLNTINAQPSAAMETAYVIDPSSNLVKQLQLIPSAFPSVPMFTVVQSQQPQTFHLYQTMNAPVTISAAGTFQQNVQPVSTSATARNYVAQHLAPVWTTDTIKRPVSCQPGSAVASQAGQPTKSKITVKIGQPGKNVSSSVPSTSEIESKTEFASKNEGSPSKQNGSETEIPRNKMKVFKKKEKDGRYLISKKDGKTIVVPYDSSKHYDGKIKETFITPNLGKLVFPSPHEGETIMVVVPSSIPMVGIGNSSRATSNDIKPKPGPACYKRKQMSSEGSQPSKLPANNAGSKGSGPPTAKRTQKMTVSTEFKPEKGQLDRIYDNKRLLKLPNYKTWSIQLLNQREDKKMAKYIFIAETVLKGDEMIRQRMLKIHDTLKFELFVFSNNLTPMFNEKNDLIRSFSALQELLDNFSAFNVCSGVTGFAHIPESSYPEGRRVANCWYSNSCTSLCADTTVCAECTGLLGILSCIDLGNANRTEEEQASGFQTEVFFLNPDFASPEKGNAAAYVTLNDHSDLIATSSAPGDQQQGVYYTFDSNNVMGQPMQYENVMTSVEVPENPCSTTTVPVPSTASAISPPLYVLAPLNL